MSRIVSLFAPITGLSRAIEQVPDPVFAGKMVGDGIAIDPLSNILYAPCDGEVINIHSSHHALTIKTEQGLEILIHIGLESVSLKGKGFNVKINQGDKIKQGQELIEFDADYIALNAKSLLTEIVIANMEMVDNLNCVINKAVKANNDKIIDITLKQETDKSATTSSGEEVLSWDIDVINKTGMHARPAASLVNAAKKYKSDIKIIKATKEANAKSVVAIMGLDIAHADKISFKATGSDAIDALTEIIPLAASGFGESGTVAVSKKTVVKEKAKGDINTIIGVSASSGIGIGNLFIIKDEVFDLIEKSSDTQAEYKKLDTAIASAKKDITKLYEQFEKVDKEKAEIFMAHQEILEDPDLIDNTKIMIDKGFTAETSWDKSFREQMSTLQSLQSELLAARANDIRDVGLRVLRILTGKVQNTEIPKGSIVIANDLSPSDLTNMNDVAGIATVHGSATSHFTIIAKTLGIPSIVGIEDRALELESNKIAVIDGQAGTLKINIKEDEIEKFKKQQDHNEKIRIENLAQSSKPAITIDGIKIEVVGNAGNIKDAQDVIANGGEGIGLLRSEFLFLDKNKAPSEQEQEKIYSEIADAMGKDRILIIRTLDVGGDKPLPYIDMPHEENPFLGVRGIRLCLQNEDLFRTQLRSIFKASDKTKLKIMFPMITDFDEIIKTKQIINEEIGEVPRDIEIGIMVEVPSAALMAEELAEIVDFFSIGTNDLTQYTLAMDRANSSLAKQADAFNPAVLRMINLTVKGAKKHNKWVGVCGSLASEEMAVPVLIGLGVKELSAAAPSIPSVKAMIRTLSMTECQKIANDVIAMKTANEVRKYLKIKLQK